MKPTSTRLLAVFFLAAMTALSAPAFAEGDEPVAVQQGPVLQFQEPAHDFGTIPFAGDGSHDFKFTNVGTEPAVIETAKGSCGCTVPNWSREPIMPGDSSVITVTYDTKRVGGFTKYVTVLYNAEAPVRLSITGGVAAPPPKAD